MTAPSATLTSTIPALGLHLPALSRRLVTAREVRERRPWPVLGRVDPVTSTPGERPRTPAAASSTAASGRGAACARPAGGGRRGARRAGAGRERRGPRAARGGAGRGAQRG